MVKLAVKCVTPTNRSWRYFLAWYDMSAEDYDAYLDRLAAEEYAGVHVSGGPAACKNCKYSTGEPMLPCAVNPTGYGEICRDYT